ncbi:MAG: hypothetical protein ACRDM0_01660 [Thermoleophilaceae bacterium]
MMRSLSRALVIGILALLALATLGTVAIADNGDLMRQMMGDAGFAAMVEQMRGVLGAEQTAQMIAACEAHMAASAADSTMQGGMLRTRP